ncbi:hypothetical protein EVAR_41950_1 [Eumeta japonica]|uniref:Uncharacterized protein n=1 Tax=Eumeta variegata TaxID=151549 RepID=A0A4C1WRF3_EUMVA|nr:hypothetical protein EVAR_41950_1 [Eumeta japonica]
MRLGFLIGDCPPPITLLGDDYDNTMGVLTIHIRTVVKSSSRTVSAKSDGSELLRDVSELIRAKNAALRRTRKCPARVEEAVRHRVFLPPKDDLDSITHDKVSKHIKDLKIRRAPGRDTISSKALK